MSKKNYNIQEDRIFKYVFKNKAIVDDFINSFLAYLNINHNYSYGDTTTEKYVTPVNKYGKDFYLDILGNLENGEIVSIEMYKDPFNKRMYNKSFLYMNRLFELQSQNIEDNKYEQIKKVININLMRGNFRRINKELVNTYKFQNDKNKMIDDGNVEMYLIRFDLVKSIAYNINEERFITWLRLINAEGLEELERIGGSDEIMNSAIKFIKKWHQEENERRCDEYIQFIKDEAEDAGEKKGRKAGRAEGRKVGRAEGRKVGRVEGREIGRKESLIETAKNLLNLNVDINTIMKATGLSKKQLKELQ